MAEGPTPTPPPVPLPAAAAMAPQPPPQPLCASDALAERGRAHGFDVLQYGRPARAFVLRFDGELRAYLNRCLHVPTEMDWQPGEFLDADKRWILCSIHGATYEPADGRCVGGPCGRGRLTPVDVREEAGQVVWLPSRDIRPVPAATPLIPVPPGADPGSAPPGADESTSS